MIDSYDICDECGLEILDDKPIKGTIDGESVQFCSTRCWHHYDKAKRDEKGGDCPG